MSGWGGAGAGGAARAGYSLESLPPAGPSAPASHSGELPPLPAAAARARSWAVAQPRAVPGSPWHTDQPGTRSPRSPAGLPRRLRLRKPPAGLWAQGRRSRSGLCQDECPGGSEVFVVCTRVLWSLFSESLGEFSAVVL